MPIAVIVDWYGPYTGLNFLRDAVQADGRLYHERSTWRSHVGTNSSMLVFQRNHVTVSMKGTSS